MSRSALFLYKGVGWDFDHKIIDSIKRLHLAGKWITVTSVGMDAGICPSDVSRWFRDHGIFWDRWRKEWVVVVPEMMGEALTAKLPEGSIKPANWIMRSFWLNNCGEEAAR
jgi:hypothetical protein